MIHMRPFNEFEENNLTFLAQKSIEFTLVQITATGYKKSILDATEPMRQYFKDKGMHNYENQAQGQIYKVVLDSCILDESSAFQTNVSLYRPETKKGDPRIWVSKLTKYCEPDDILMMIYYSKKLFVVNLTKTDIKKVCSYSIMTPLKKLISAFHLEVMGVSLELTDKLRELAKRWHSADILADTGVGRAIENLLGIEMNSSKLPDYKGIELKSFRDKRPNIRSTLFCQVPDWRISRLKSAKEIVKEYGYTREGVLTYQNTLYCTKLNSQNLGLTLYQLDELLAIEEKEIRLTKEGFTKYSKVTDVALWRLPILHDRLLEKHHETFWIEVESVENKGKEFFRPILVEHTKNPVVAQFDNLLETGYISVDLLLSRPSGNGDTIAFKINKKARPMLFPESEKILLR